MALAATAASYVDVNSATAQQLESVSGIGPSTARTIVQERERAGAFESLDDLAERVRGIGPKKAKALQAAGLTVGGADGAAQNAAQGAATPAGKGGAPAGAAQSAKGGAPRRPGAAMPSFTFPGVKDGGRALAPARLCGPTRARRGYDRLHDYELPHHRADRRQYAARASAAYSRSCGRGARQCHPGQA
ncbi:helix-hairpin-helix domain-containing protein [Achromobacter xylosoxidans]